MKNYTMLSLDRIESIKNKKLYIIKNLEEGIWRDGKARSKLYVISNDHLNNLISHSRARADMEMYPELKVLEEEIYNLLVNEQTKRITDRKNTLNQINNNNNNMNEVTEVQTELSGIAPDAIIELAPTSATGIGFITAHNKLYRIVECKLAAAGKNGAVDRYVCLIENLDSHHFNTRFFTRAFHEVLSLFKNKKSIVDNIETLAEMKARWKTMQIPEKHIFALLRRSDSSHYKAMENYVKKHNAIQFSSNAKAKVKKVKQPSVEQPESTSKNVEIKKESNVNTPYFVYSNELDEDKQFIMNLYLKLDESFQDKMFSELPNDIKNAIYERLPVSRQKSVFEKLVEKANKSYKNNG
jgi:hypothetical protein